MPKDHSQHGNEMLSNGRDFTGDYSENEGAHSSHYEGDAPSSSSASKKWDVFRDPPPKMDTGSMADQRCYEITAQLMKLIVYLLVFAIVLVSGLISKGAILFMTSQLKDNRRISYCNRQLGRDRQFVVQLPEEERIAWIWCIIAAVSVPDLGSFIRSVRVCIFKSLKKPTTSTFIFVLIVETFYALGKGLLVFCILPDLDVVRGAMIMSSVCFIPGVLGLLSRDGKYHLSSIFLDFAALISQASAFVVWPMLEDAKTSTRLIPLAVILISCGWWENYVSTQNSGKSDKKGPLRFLIKVKEELQSTRYFTYMFMSIWRIAMFFLSGVFILHLRGQNIFNLFTKFGIAFKQHMITVQAIRPTTSGTIPDFLEFLPSNESETINSEMWAAIYILLIQIGSSYFVYIFGKFACKILIQPFSYAMPISITTLLSIIALMTVCGLRNANPCYFHGRIPDYLFFSGPPNHVVDELLIDEFGWCWLLWGISQLYFTIHIWMPKCERLAATEKLFVMPMYDSLLIDQSMGLNRKRDDQPEVKVEDLAEIEREKGEGDYETIYDRSDASVIKNSDHVKRILACATMWHETKEEMMTFLKSILRLDADQCARRIAQQHLKIVDPDYYEFETHIFFDDAYEKVNDSEKMQVNPFVKLLINTLNEAASEVHLMSVRIRAPKVIPAPYGGQLIWTLPGKTKMIAHLKDKSRIRHRKRWSQVMYMYYLLGHRLMDLSISVHRKEVIAENTYLLALDGDIDFQPSAVKLLVDLMKKNKNLGAACGRIHPVGSGLMVWYQKFEYAIGHWMQKATEHEYGSVLCSPGCFSLFRAKALMDDNVMKKYTTKSEQPRHYVQYDQGEDRWLCTLLLQRGYRVEYSAASDAYTHAPEGFDEFYNQRRRWVPSTIANIMDLLFDAEATTKANDNISMFYIYYQHLLMGGTILGPGTIFLMLVGACVAVFKIDNWTSFYFNAAPIFIFIFVCFTMSSKAQLMLAKILSVAYALLMTAVIVGTALQLDEDGIGSPSAIFLICMLGSFTIAACLHPQEFGCFKHFIIYLLSIPSMYLLLILYSIINLNVVTWGTREVLDKKALEEERIKAEEAKKNSLLNRFLRNFESINRGGKSSSEEMKKLDEVCETLKGLGERLKKIESAIDPDANNRRTSVSKAIDTISVKDENSLSEVKLETENHQDNNQNNMYSRRKEDSRYWLRDETLRQCDVEIMPAQEEIFWKELIEKYLYPIDGNKEEQDRIAKQLKELRNKSVFMFLMLNALFVLIVFLFQLHKEMLHVKWPFGIRTNVTLDDVTQEVLITKEYLQLEPIGLVFVFFFFLIMVIQFIGMLLHRFGTFSHILASTNIFSKKYKTAEEVLRAQLEVAVEKLKNPIRDNDIYYNESCESGPGRRKTIRNLENNRKIKKSPITTLDTPMKREFFNFQKEMNDYQDFACDLPESSKNKKWRRKSNLQTLGSNNTYAKTVNPLDVKSRKSKSSKTPVMSVFDNNGAYANPAFDASLENPMDLQSSNIDTKLSRKKSGSREEPLEDFY